MGQLGPATLKSRLAGLLLLLPPVVTVALILLNYRLRGRIGLVQQISAMPGSSCVVDRLGAGMARRLFPVDVAALLLAARKPQKAEDILSGLPSGHLTPRAAHLHAQTLFALGRFAEAARVLRDGAADVPEFRARLCLIEGGDEATAMHLLSLVAERRPELRRPHQNLSAPHHQPYRPNAVDAAAGANGLLYDAYNLSGQLVTHVGAGDRGAALFARACMVQETLRRSLDRRTPVLPPGELAELGLDLGRLRLLPAEWGAKIGHVGLIDILLRMKTRGWWDGDPVILAAPEQICNRPALMLFRDDARILIRGENVVPDLFDRLNSLQRYVGLSFNCWTMPDGQVVPWQEAGAKLMWEWEAAGLDYPLRQAYDTLVAPEVLQHWEELRRTWGMGEGDWHVCLHARDAAFYQEPEGTGQTHRNAKLENYQTAIGHITAQGGWVIRMGDAGSTPLPAMPRVIDYACSPLCSAALDLHLIRTARLFIGTTSGLTNMAVSFGIPCALVNCITTDAQPWSGRVRFALKPVWDAAGRLLGPREMTEAPARWALYSAESMSCAGLRCEDNSPDEILETVKEVEALADGRISTGSSGLLERWRYCLTFPHFYGAGLPSGCYLDKYQRTLVS